MKKLSIDLTIIIPTYNRKELLEITTKHLLDCFEPFSNFKFQIIISDNASIESPRFIIEKIADDRIIFLENKNNLGITRNILNSSKLAKGKFLWIFGDDDLVDFEGIKKIVSLIKNEDTFEFLQIGVKSFKYEEDINWKEKGKNIKTYPLNLMSDLKKIDSNFGFISSNIFLTNIFLRVTEKVFNRDPKLLNNNYSVKLINYEIYKISTKKITINDELIYQRISHASSFYKSPELIFKTFFEDLNEILNYHKLYNTEFLITRKIYFKQKIDILIIKLFHQKSFNRVFKIFQYSNYLDFYILFILITPKIILKKLYIIYKKVKGDELPFVYRINEV